MSLSEREQAILDFERGWWTEDGVKDLMLRERFSCSADDYYNELNRLLDTAEALAYDPLVVRRLQRRVSDVVVCVLMALLSPEGCKHEHRRCQRINRS